MAAAGKLTRLAVEDERFLPLKAVDGISKIGRRKRVNKNKKKNWNKYSDIHDVEEFLDDVRLQERVAGGLIANKPNDGLFFVDTGKKVIEAKPETKKLGKTSKPLRIDLILQPASQIAAPKDILAYQRPNAKKERRMAQRVEKLAAKGVLARREKLLKLHKSATVTHTREKLSANNHPSRNFYDLWTTEEPETADPYYLEQTKRKLVTRPRKLNEKPSILPAVEVIGPGGSYNPDFISHQTLLQEALNVAVKTLKAEEKLERQVEIDKKNIATEESTFKEQVEGLIDDDEIRDETQSPAINATIGPALQREKKTEKQRRKEKTQRKKELQKKVKQKLIDNKQQLFQLRAIKAELKKREQNTKLRQMKRKEKQETQKALPRRLGRLKFQAPDLDIKLSDELADSLRTLKPEGSILKDRFKSLQKRNLIEPRERAKFIRKYRIKYVEKRAFKEIE